MIIICSAQYIDQEFVSEIGLLPPSLLPVGNRRLYEHQIELLKPLNERIIITFPESIVLSDYEVARIRSLGVEIIYVKRGLSLGAAIYSAIRDSSVDLFAGDNSLSVLFGDTLFGSVPNKKNIFLTGSNKEYYKWGAFNEAQSGLKFSETFDPGCGDSELLSGWFSFHSLTKYLSCLESSNFSFIESLNLYSELMNLSPVRSDVWLDFGHIHTYFQSKAKKTTERAFNSLKIDGRVVIKAGEKISKLKAEANWYESIPAELKLYAPIYLGSNKSDGKFDYKVEYLYLSTLSELLVHGNLPVKVWSNIFGSCHDFLLACNEALAPSESLPQAHELLFGKNKKRLSELSRSGMDIKNPFVINDVTVPSLVNIVLELESGVRKSCKEDLGIMHGDFCFSNIMYDFRTQSVKCIDPRGVIDGYEPSIFGDVRYDMAKFYHSIVGCYDFIMAGFYELKESGINKFEFEVFVNDEFPALYNMSASYSIDFVTESRGLRDTVKIMTSCPTNTASVFHCLASQLKVSCE